MVGRWFAIITTMVELWIVNTYEKDTRITLILAYWLMHLYPSHNCLVVRIKRGLETILGYTGYLLINLEQNCSERLIWLYMNLDLTLREVTD